MSDKATEEEESGEVDVARVVIKRRPADDREVIADRLGSRERETAGINSVRCDNRADVSRILPDPARSRPGRWFSGDAGVYARAQPMTPREDDGARARPREESRCGRVCSCPCSNTQGPLSTTGLISILKQRKCQWTGRESARSSLSDSFSLSLGVVVVTSRRAAERPASDPALPCYSCGGLAVPGPAFSMGQPIESLTLNFARAKRDEEAARAIVFLRW